MVLLGKEVLGLAPETWDVIGVIVTAGAFFVGSLVGLVAYFQLRQSRDAQRDQARPYVMLTVEPSAVSFGFLELKLQNVGRGPAYDVAIKADPPFVRSDELTQSGKPELGGKKHKKLLAQTRMFREPIEMLPPGFAMTTFFDSMVDRCKVEDQLPSHHKVTLSYRDRDRQDRWRLRSPAMYVETHVIDLDLYHDMQYLEVYGIHHAAKALREMKTMWKETNKHLRNPIAVTTQEQGKYDEVRRLAAAERRGAMLNYEERQREPQRGSGSEGDGVDE